MKTAPKGQMPPTPAVPVRQKKQMAGQKSVPVKKTKGCC